MTTVTSPANTATTNTLLDQAAKTTSGVGADFNMFLKMLTVQMQNQDPLDPMDTSEYTKQLVQFSQVEQSMQQTGVLKDILSRVSSQDMAQASAFIGREARFDSNVSGLGATGNATWTVAPARAAESMTVKVTDAAGKVVREETIDATTSRFSWDGKLADGSRAPEGAYKLAVTAKDKAGAAIGVGINGVGIVKDVITDGTNVTLGIGGARMALSELVAVSAA